MYIFLTVNWNVKSVAAGLKKNLFNYISILISVS